MKIIVEKSKEKDNFYKVIPDSAIDSDSHMDFKEKIDPVMAKKPKAILLDLTDVDYISSAGLGVLFTMKKVLVERGGELLFCGVQPQIQKLFDIVKALPKETVFADEQEADRYFYAIQKKEIDRQKSEGGSGGGNQGF